MCGVRGVWSEGVCGGRGCCVKVCDKCVKKWT